jgi:hypothetical protein
MIEVRHAHPYPRDGVLRFERKRSDGEIPPARVEKKASRG